jgi:hypothetical protein
VHQQPGLIGIELLACGLDFGFSAVSLIEPEAAVERFEHDHLPADGRLRWWKRGQEDGRQAEQATGLGVRLKFSGAHGAPVKMTSRDDHRIRP